MIYERVINFLLDRIEELEKEIQDLKNELHCELMKQFFKKENEDE